MLPEYRVYFVRGEDNLEYGPVDMEELREWVRENRAGLGTSIRYDEPGSTWQPWQNYPELIALLAEARVAGPTQGPPGLVIAPIWRRAMAWILDLIPLFILFIPILSILSVFLSMDDITKAMADPSTLATVPSPIFHQVVAFQIIVNAFVVLYLAWFYTRRGQTPAKALLHLRVVDRNGHNPTLVRSFIRALAFIFSINLFFFPMTYAFLNPQRRTFHDFVAGTYVVEA
jgi:uncharacterized RDD family membrane protein YckC